MPSPHGGEACCVHAVQCAEQFGNGMGPDAVVQTGGLPLTDLDCRISAHDRPIGDLAADDGAKGDHGA